MYNPKIFFNSIFSSDKFNSRKNIPEEKNSDSYKINGDVLEYPDGHSEKIFPSVDCIANPDFCYTKMNNSQFGLTNVPLEFFKLNDGTDPVITRIVAPAKTKICFDNTDITKSKQKRIETGIVADQFSVDDNNKKVPKHDTLFDVYEIGKKIKYRGEYCDEYALMEDYRAGLYDLDPMQKSGIYVYSNLSSASYYHK